MFIIETCPAALAFRKRRKQSHHHDLYSRVEKNLLQSIEGRCCCMGCWISKNISGIYQACHAESDEIKLERCFRKKSNTTQSRQAYFPNQRKPYIV